MKDYHPYLDYPKPRKPVTNADRIRAMSDEELAQWVERIRMLCANEYCGKACPLFEICMSSGEKQMEALDWLRQEATADA